MTISAARSITIATLLALFASWSSCSAAEELAVCLSTTEPTLDVYCYAREADRLQQVSETFYAQKLREFDSLPAALAISNDLKQSARSHFVVAQTHWREYEEAFCRFQSDTTLGTGRELVYSRCKIDLTKRRIAELQAAGF